MIGLENKNKPVIGITKPDNKDFFIYCAIWFSTILAGGKPVKITARREYQKIHLDGIIFGGGKDIFPEHYKQTPKEEYSYDPDRDAMELFWARKAIEDNIPSLGICRGAQLMNVACAGSLHKSVAEAYSDANYPDGIIHHAFYRKEITIGENTLLRTIIGEKRIKVNSIHKQAIDRIGDGLQINAQEDNGVIQAVAHKSHPFFLGIQFHPEFLIYRAPFRRLFSALVMAAAK